MQNQSSTILIVVLVLVGGYVLLRRSSAGGATAPGGSTGPLGSVLQAVGGAVNAPPTYPNIASAPLSPAGGSTQGALVGFVKGGVKGAVIGGSFLAYGPLGPVAVGVGQKYGGKIVHGLKSVFDDIF